MRSKHYFFLYLFFFFIFPAFCFCQEKTLPASLMPFVLKGYEMLDFIEGDLNADKKTDAILILRVRGEDTITTGDLKRPFLLLIAQQDGKLKLVKRNDNLVMCRQCGGVFGDPYEGLEIIKNGFSISFYGGSSWRWAYTYSFEYNITKKNWFLAREHQLSYHNTEPELNTTGSDIEAEELGVIPIEKFTSDPPYVDSKWKVIVTKAYFYDNPKIGSKPRKGYLLKGDRVTGIRYLKNFIEVSFQNKKEVFTSGYVLRSDIQKIK
ncbi:MAG: hypothetical protein ABI741_10720 [Ferruginibacter sp.]